MLKITRGKVNKCIFTLTEKTDEDDNFFLKLKSNNSNESKTLTLGTDLSPNKIRFNEFDIEEVDESSENLLNAMIHLNQGTYDYTVLQVISGITEVIETGLCKVVQTGSTEHISDNTFTANDDDSTYVFK